MRINRILTTERCVETPMGIWKKLILSLFSEVILGCPDWVFCWNIFCNGFIYVMSKHRLHFGLKFSLLLVIYVDYFAFCRCRHHYSFLGMKIHVSCNLAGSINTDSSEEDPWDIAAVEGYHTVLHKGDKTLFLQIFQMKYAKRPL